MSTKSDITADFEQVEQTVIHVAIVIQSYYDQLVKSGLDPEFARELARDFASNWWDSLFQHIKGK